MKENEQRFYFKPNSHIEAHNEKKYLKMNKCVQTSYKKNIRWNVHI